MVVLKECLTVEIVEVEQSSPQSGAFASGVHFERDVRDRPNRHYRREVLAADVALVSRDFGGKEPSCGCAEESWEIGGVIRRTWRDFDACHHVGLDANHQVALKPFVFAPHLPVLSIVPSDKSASRKTTGVHGKVGFHGFERAGAFFDQRLEDRREHWVFEVVEGRIVTGRPGKVALLLAGPSVAHCAPSRHAGIDLRYSGKHHVSKRQPRPSHRLRGLDDASAKPMQQFGEAFAFVGLCEVVGGPVLLIGDTCRLDFLDSRGDRRRPVPLGLLLAGDFLLDGEFDCIDMLTLHMPERMVGASAMRRIPVQSHGVGVTVGRLGRNKPEASLLLQSRGRCYFHASLFSRIHLLHSSRFIYYQYILSLLTSQYFRYIVLVDKLGDGKWQYPRSQGRSRRQSLSRIDVDVATNGIHVDQASDLASAQNARVLTGIGHTSSVGRMWRSTLYYGTLA